MKVQKDFSQRREERGEREGGAGNGGEFEKQMSTGNSFKLSAISASLRLCENKKQAC